MAAAPNTAASTATPWPKHPPFVALFPPIPIQPPPSSQQTNRTRVALLNPSLVNYAKWIAFSFTATFITDASAYAHRLPLLCTSVILLSVAVLLLHRHFNPSITQFAITHDISPPPPPMRKLNSNLPSLLRCSFLQIPSVRCSLPDNHIPLLPQSQ